VEEEEKGRRRFLVMGVVLVGRRFDRFQKGIFQGSGVMMYGLGAGVGVWLCLVVVTPENHRPSLVLKSLVHKELRSERGTESLGSFRDEAPRSTYPGKRQRLSIGSRCFV
jgi:hypothetical protein